ncbi:EAL domain-containing protein [Arcobacter sp. YIC-310]|uniref:EAL domain-containing protein n=1 Tax=Arcobacter sp. YIC-310 TaxID=3376632 RepID=UPI003C18655A
MTNRIFFKVTWMLILLLLAYLFFVVFFLSPKINTYLANTQKEQIKEKFEKIVSTINYKSKSFKDKEKFIYEIDFLLKNISLGKNGYVYIFDKTGKLIVNPSSELNTKNVKEIKLKQENITLYDKVMESYKKEKTFTYNWNRVYDPNNFTYEKVSWIRYNKTLDYYIVSSIYTEEFSIFLAGINSLLLNISLLLFSVLAIIGIFITIKVISPLNKMLNEVKDEKTKEFYLSKKTNDEIGFLANQFNSMINQIENNKQNLEVEVKAKTKEIQEKLFYDELTTLENRYALEENIKNEDFVSLIIIDIDSFNDLNELYGFSSGNLVLIEVAKRLRTLAIKYNSTAYRIYGNEFAIVKNNMLDTKKFQDLMRELNKLFKNKSIYLENLNIDIFIDITTGISLGQEEPLKTAGIALKKAKSSNLKSVSYSDEFDTKELIKKAIYWRDKIKDAIEKDNIVPFFQAICNDKKEVVKYETLMRIRDKNEKGEEEYILPYKFLDVAIKTKQYPYLASQLFKKTFEALKNTDKQISINLSFKDIQDRTFVEMLDNYLNHIDNVYKNRLVFELLESDFISDYKILNEFIKKYRAQGIKIAIDDFGTGYSNFAHILETRPDYIKIDGSLIKSINEDKNSYEIVKSIVEFSKALNIKVIAEFIHSEEVFKTVLEMGVNEFQGYYLAKPNINID